MRGNKEKELLADRKLVEENQHLLPVRYRDQVKLALEPETEVMEVEEIVLEGEKRKVKTKRKQKLRRDGTVEEDEEMEVDA